MSIESSWRLPPPSLHFLLHWPFRNTVAIAELAPVALVLALTASLGLGCAQILGIPGEPQLRSTEVTNSSGSGEDSLSSFAGEQIEDDAGSTGSPLSGANVSTEGTLDIPLTTANQPGPISTEGQSRVDAGTNQSSLAPDGGVPPINDAAAPEVAGCAVFALRGPNEHCYAPLTALQSWQDSRDACLALGAGWDLVSIRSEEENDFIFSLGVDELWIGASDQAESDAWLWVDDETPFWVGNQETGQAVGTAYVNWNANEPNGGGGSGCARIVAAVAGTWADLECGSERAALCMGPSAALRDAD